MKIRPLSTKNVNLLVTQVEKSVWPKAVDRLLICVSPQGVAGGVSDAVKQSKEHFV